MDEHLVPYFKDTDAAFIIVDHFKVHLTRRFRSLIENLACDIDDTPAGYTCVLQPVDVGVNATIKRPFRHFIMCGALPVPCAFLPTSLTFPTRVRFFNSFHASSFCGIRIATLSSSSSSSSEVFVVFFSRLLCLGLTFFGRRCFCFFGRWCFCFGLSFFGRRCF